MEEEGVVHRLRMPAVESKLGIQEGQEQMGSRWKLVIRIWNSIWGVLCPFMFSRSRRCEVGSWKMVERSEITVMENEGQTFGSHRVAQQPEGHSWDWKFFSFLYVQFSLLESSPISTLLTYFSSILIYNNKNNKKKPPNPISVLLILSSTVPDPIFLLSFLAKFLRRQLPFCSLHSLFS